MSETLTIGGETYALKFEAREHYLAASVSGPRDSLDISLEIWSQLAKHCQARGYDRLLVEENLGTQLSEYEMFELASRLPAHGFGGIKVALIDAECDHKDGNRFGETVARNRGMDIQVCRDIDQAEAFLLSEE
jgi:hypothetical protein